MADPAQEQLLGYLLGALEDSEREFVEHRLKQNPKLLRELARMQEGLQPLWVAQPDFVPPPGLAAETCEFVASHSQFQADPPHQANHLPSTEVTAAETFAGATPVQSGSHGLLDFAVAAGVVVAASLLIFPAIQNSRFSAHVDVCKNRLRQLGLALTQYSDRHADYFPPVYDDGPFAGSGIYAPVLMSTGFLDDPRCFVCPESPLAEDEGFRIPSLEELAAACGEELAELQSTMGGSYGYALGFVQNGRYYNIRNLRRPYYGLIADVPCLYLPGYQSENHGGLGQNVLHEDGSAAFYHISKPHAQADDVFVNELGRVAPGRNRDDSVIGPSTSVPRMYEAVFVGQ